MEITANIGTLPYGVGAILQQLPATLDQSGRAGATPFRRPLSDHLPGQEWITLPTVDAEGDDRGEQDFRITIECLDNLPYESPERRPIREYGAGPNIAGGTNRYTERPKTDGEPAP